MKVLSNRSFFSAILCSILGLSFSVQAESLSGTVGVSITLTSSCLINSNAVAAGSSFGSLDFGPQTTMFNTATATVQGTTGSPMTIQCNATTAPTITLVSGGNDSHASGNYNHSMANGSKYVSYSLYTDSGHTTDIPLNNTFFTSANDGSVENVNIYAKASGGNGLTPGLYTDTITLQLDF